MKNLRIAFMLIAAICAAPFMILGQVSVNTDGTSPHASAMLDVKSTTKGLLIPRMSTAQRTTLGAIATAGLMVYDTDLNKFYYHNGSGWLEGSTGAYWTRSGSVLYNTNTTDNIGIGTSTPGYVAGAARYFTISTPGFGSNQIASLELKGAAVNTYNPVTRIDFISHGTTGTIYNVARIETRITNALYEGELLFYTSGVSFAERMRIDRNGYVGIGTAAPGRTLEVFGGSSPLRLSSSGLGVGMEFLSSTATDWGIMTWGNNLRFVTSTDNFASTADEYFFDQNEFTPWTNGTKTVGSSAKRFGKIYSVDGDFSGTVGIGTTAPARTLEVKSTDFRAARISSTTAGAGIELVGTAATDWALTNWNSALYIETSEDDFATRSTAYFLTKTYLRPWTDNTANLGLSTFKWSTVYGVNANFTGTASIGTQTYMGNLHVHEGTGNLASIYITPSTTVSGDSSKIFMGEDAIAYYGMYWLYDGSSNNMQLFGKSGSTIYGPHFSVNRNTGNAAFGSTFATGYKLSVSGKIICEELRVNLVASWPDYVFKKDYSLLPVEQLGSYVEENGHLPNVPAAAEIEKTGFDVGNMQKIMMEKIEELSLYIIEQQKQIKELKEQVNELQNK
jgi:hypothetical protein